MKALFLVSLCCISGFLVAESRHQRDLDDKNLFEKNQKRFAEKREQEVNQARRCHKCGQCCGYDEASTQYEYDFREGPYAPH